MNKKSYEGIMSPKYEKRRWKAMTARKTSCKTTTCSKAYCIALAATVAMGAAQSVRASLDNSARLSSAAPETWFHIIDGNVTREGLSADIAAIADAGISGIQFFHHALNTFAKTSLVKVDAEDILATVEFMQTTPVLVGLADFQWSHNGLQFGEQGVG